MAVIAGRVSWLVMNFGFWVGSLWGDTVGDHFASGGDAWGSWVGAEAFEASALFVPGWVFAASWAAVSVATIIWLKNNRFAVNASITFLAINAYTQFFEWFGASAFVVWEIRMLRAMWQGLKTGLRTDLTGHERGNPGHRQDWS
jgi:hypothetical protein